MDKHDAAATTPGGAPMWYSHQADEMRASKLIGSKVVNAANETVGDINEIVPQVAGKRRRSRTVPWRVSPP